MRLWKYTIDSKDMKINKLMQNVKIYQMLSHNRSSQQCKTTKYRIYKIFESTIINWVLTCQIHREMKAIQDLTKPRNPYFKRISQNRYFQRTA